MLHGDQRQSTRQQHQLQPKGRIGPVGHRIDRHQPEARQNRQTQPGPGDAAQKRHDHRQGCCETHPSTADPSAAPPQQQRKAQDMRRVDRRIGITIPAKPGGPGHAAMSASQSNGRRPGLVRRRQARGIEDVVLPRTVILTAFISFSFASRERLPKMVTASPGAAEPSRNPARSTPRGW